MEPGKDIDKLLKRYLNDESTQEEVKQLLELNNAHPDADWYPYLEELFKNGRPDAGFTKEKWGPVLRSILQKRNAKVPDIRAYRWWQLAAACFLLALGTSFWWLVMHKPDNYPVAKAPAKDIPAPARSHATITLADGQTVNLDSVGKGQLAQQGTIKLFKLANGQIAYQTSDGQIVKELQYNTLTNPRGSKVINIQLSDGSRVWLNAGSSITYPAAFTGRERNVELDGEGYFEVVKDRARKFIVSSNGVTTEVLGTHFNVNAYGNAQGARVTLLEGSVRTGNKDGAVVITPGQQAIAGKGSVKVNVSPSLDQVMAWKNGIFNFNRLSIEEAMGQIETWYDVTVEYPSGKPGVRLFGEMGRDLSLLEVLESLKEVGIRCRLEGKIVTVY